MHLSFEIKLRFEYMKSVWIILVNYKNPELTIECVESLRKSKSDNLHIVVVDNNSPDDSYEQLIEELPNEIIIKSEENNGFSAGNNIGIKYALENDAEYIMLLNNDTVIDETMVEQLLNNSDDFTVTVPKMYYYSQPETIWYAGGTINRKTGKTYHIGENRHDDGSFNEQKYVDFATGCCIMMSRAVIEKVGLWDESYFLYWEDVDYSFRLAEAGIKILYVPEAKLWHKVNASTGSSSPLTVYYSNRNRMYVMKKYKFPITAWIYFYLTRLIYLMKNVFMKNDNQYILRAMKDYRDKKTGKSEI